MSRLRRLKVRVVEAPRWQRMAFGVASVIAGPYAAWRSFLSRGTTCVPQQPVDVSAQILRVECIPQAWEAWWRWPGMALGLALLLVGIVALVHVSRAAEPARRPRRSRRARGT